MTLARFIATFGGCGLSPRAPGTVGSFAALLLGVPMLKRPRLLASSAIAASLVGWWAASRAGDGEDHGWIVIDEVAGMWLALLGCLPVAEHNALTQSGVAAPEHTGVPALTTRPWFLPLLAFGLFRLFDITKPGPVGTLDRRHDAAGIMGDDIVAGLMAAGCVKAFKVLSGLRAART
ncbi:phosphatidylglycerophosphatase A [Acetobacter suratthaniensis]|uniref:Phosphatidylglycerophosphatase A n=1 Tax=Acetobacter suratthaniensis TaxID=1502841 RepID=A0ABS3LIQ8_9PROT|nr:phosphatidylglycerophosphatase A [Acetobacter suratthaniensis]MBO1327483.1 phosphatidylglycerophosphatase A [Acetobacter suratthaniensis]MCX2564903.1 phosphatidylglycerophosphatase A [Acetobacter suratthaniensis]